MHPVYRVTHIGRPILPAYPTNRAILIVMAAAVLAGPGWSLLRSAGAGEVAWAALSAPLTCFLAWALGRELAPDDNPAAFIGVALAAVAWAWWGRPDLWFLVGLQGAARLVNRTVGPPAKLSDALAVLGGCVALAFALNETGLLVAATIALLLDGVLPNPRRLHLWFGGAGLAALGTNVMLSRGWHAGQAMPALVLAAATALFAVVIALTPTPRSKGDISDEPLDRRRVQAGMAVVLAASVWTTLAADRPGAIATVWAVMAGVALGRVVSLVRRTA